MTALVPRGLKHLKIICAVCGHEVAWTEVYASSAARALRITVRCHGDEESRPLALEWLQDLTPDEAQAISSGEIAGLAFVPSAAPIDPFAPVGLSKLRPYLPGGAKHRAAI